MGQRKQIFTRATAIQAFVFVTTLMVVFVAAIGSGEPVSHVNVTVDGVKKAVASDARTVGELLDDIDIDVGKKDTVTPSVFTKVTENMSINVRSAVPVKLYVNSGFMTFDTSAATVSQVLQEANVRVSSAKELYPAANSPIKANSVIVINPSTTIKKISEKVTPYEVTKKTSFALAPGKTRVVTKGVGGLTQVFEQRIYQGSALVSTSTIEKPIRAAVNEIVEVGAGPETGKLGRSINVEATAYVPGYDGVGWRTATGTRAGYGQIAVDPRVIPLGSKVYIPGYGYAVATDTGGAIKGARIDLCYNTIGPALQWGRRGAVVYFVQ